MHEFAVGAGGEHLAVAIGELRVQVAEALDLGRADEREILRIEEHQRPLALVRVVVDFGERRIEVLDGHGGLEVELRKLVADGKHVSLLGM